MSDDPEALKAAAKLAYCSTFERVEDLTRRIGISENQLITWRRHESWRRPPRGGPPPSAAASRLQEARIIRRLFSVIDKNLRSLEIRMKTNEQAAETAGRNDAGERAARETSTLIRSFEKARDIARSIDGQGESAGSDSADRSAEDRLADAEAADAERLRLSLIARLEKLAQRRP